MSCTIKQIDVLADWPDIAPAGWHVFNAPRPIYGHLYWDGDFRHGKFYAAVNPAKRDAAGYIHENRDLDAVLLRFVAESDVRAWADAYLLNHGYAKDANDFTIDECWQSYCAAGAGERQVEI